MLHLTTTSADAAATSHGDDKESQNEETAPARTQTEETDATGRPASTDPRDQHRQASRQLRRIAALTHARIVLRILLRLPLDNQKLWKMAPQHLVSLLGTVFCGGPDLFSILGQSGR